MKHKFQVSQLNLFYGKAQALYDVSLDVPENSVVALIGPSGCGKSTFLKSLNRMNDLVEGVNIQGTSLDERISTAEIRRWLCASGGLVFQRPNPFPCPSMICGLWMPGHGEKRRPA